MKPITVAAQKVFSKLIAGLKLGEAKKVDNTNGAFMAVSVDFLRRHVAVDSTSVEFYAVAHRYEQNGDLVPDPDVEFRVTRFADGGICSVAPVAIDQFGRYNRVVTCDAEGKALTWSPRSQRDLATFCGVWFKNIRQQQGL